MTKYFPVYTSLLMPVFLTSCRGQDKPELPNENIKPETKDTLNSYVWDITQDRKGNIWFAASDGVFRYDGKSFTKITGEIISEPFFSVFEDSKGNFWFGADGLWRYDGSTFNQIDQTGAGVIIEDEKRNVLTSIGGPFYVMLNSHCLIKIHVLQ